MRLEFIRFRNWYSPGRVYLSSKSRFYMRKPNTKRVSGWLVELDRHLTETGIIFHYE